MNNQAIWQIAMEQSARDCNCRPEDFRADENRVFVSAASDKAKRYLSVPHICTLVSYGSNVVASCRADLCPEIARFLDVTPDIENCFETPGLYPLNAILEKARARIYMMSAYFLPEAAEVFRYERTCDYSLRVLEPAAFAPLYLPEWKNALCADRRHLDRLAVGAFDKDRLIGLAGCSADCDTMWQIGIDVLPAYRRQGVAAALTNRLARETFARGFVPFYCAAWSNVKSVKNAVRSGFAPAWVEVSAKSAAPGCGERQRGDTGSKNAVAFSPGIH